MFQTASIVSLTFPASTAFTYNFASKRSESHVILSDVALMSFSMLHQVMVWRLEAAVAPYLHVTIVVHIHPAHYPSPPLSFLPNFQIQTIVSSTAGLSIIQELFSQ